jgi:hypothetical protein
VIDSLRHEIKFAVRSLLRSRGATTVAVLSFAIGVAANATVFSLVQAIEFPRLIYPEASHLVFLESNNTARGLNGMLVSAPDALDILAASQTLVAPAITGRDYLGTSHRRRRSASTHSPGAPRRPAAGNSPARRRSDHARILCRNWREDDLGTDIYRPG